MTFDPVILSRLQFAWVVAWHILLPSFTVGIASYIALMEGLHLFSKREVYLKVSVFWTRIFAVAFGMGVVSGITMPFQFGTNWSRFSDATANVIGPLLAYEGLTAFFLEAAFLGVLLFGRKLVPPVLHFGSALMVAAGTLFSTFWILSTNSWMQTPQGFEMGADGRLFPTDWFAVIFNPSFPYRFFHMVIALYVTTAFVVLGLGAMVVAREKFRAEGKVMMRSAIFILLFLVPGQMLAGDQHGLNTLEYQPVKLAAIEAHWETEKRVPLILFAIPDQQAEKNHFVIEVPVLGSLILTHSIDGEIKGLKDWPADQRPPVAIVFFAFRIMVAIASLMAVMLVWGLFLAVKRRLYDDRWFLLACKWSMPLGFLGVLAGWTTTEVGRQPWSVYGVLRTADSVSPALTGGDVLITLIAYTLAYLVIFPAGIYFIVHIVREGPTGIAGYTPVSAGRPHQPIGTLPGRGEDRP